MGFCDGFIEVCFELGKFALGIEMKILFALRKKIVMESPPERPIVNNKKRKSKN